MLTAALPFLYAIYANPFQYMGAYRDGESHLIALNARYYSPALHRFVSRDTLSLSNRYAYANNNPVRNVDPSGHIAAAAWLSHRMDAFPVDQLVGKISPEAAEEDEAAIVADRPETWTFEIHDFWPEPNHGAPIRTVFLTHERQGPDGVLTHTLVYSFRPMTLPLDTQPYSDLSINHLQATTEPLVLALDADYEALYFNHSVHPDFRQNQLYYGMLNHLRQLPTRAACDQMYGFFDINTVLAEAPNPPDPLDEAGFIATGSANVQLGRDGQNATVTMTNKASWDAEDDTTDESSDNEVPLLQGNINGNNKRPHSPDDPDTSGGGGIAA